MNCYPIEFLSPGYGTNPTFYMVETLIIFINGSKLSLRTSYNFWSGLKRPFVQEKLSENEGDVFLEMIFSTNFMLFILIEIPVTMWHIS